MEGPLQADVVE